MQTLQVMAAKVTLRTPDGDETIEVRWSSCLDAGMRHARAGMHEGTHLPS